MADPDSYWDVLLDSAPTAGFYLVVGLVHLALAGYFAWRKPRSEWVWIAATLFFLNGLNALGSALYVLAPDSALGNFGRLFLFKYADLAVFFLLIYLALAYPHRPRLLGRRPAVLPLLVGAGFTAAAIALAIGGPDFDYARTAGRPFNLGRLVFGFGIPGLAWSLLLVRWTFQWPRTESPLLRQEFRLIFAAFAMRAANVLVSTLPVAEKSGPFWMAVAAQLLNAIPLVLLFVSAAVIIHNQSRQIGGRRRQSVFILVFMSLGILEGTVAASLGGSWSFFGSILFHIDLFIVRPILLWLALPRAHNSGMLRRELLLGQTLLGLLSFSFFAGRLPLAFGRGLPPLVALPLAVGFSAVLAIGIAIAARPFLARRSQTFAGFSPHGPEWAEPYFAAVEEAYRNGEPDPRQVRALGRLRRDAGITQEQHEAFLTAVRSRWRPLGEWTPGVVLLGRYRIESYLGQGSFGATYLVHDTMARKLVVLKRIHGLDPQSSRAIVQEASTLARLGSAPIVHLLRTEVVGPETILVLEHAAGGSLLSLLEREGALTPKASVDVALDVLSALSAAHAAGIIHRDVKPSNILFDARGRARLADFGAAADQTSLAMPLGDPTQVPTQGGTLRYMAPEQVLGRGADARSDVYATGAVLYEMLVGLPLVPQDCGDYEARRRIVEERVPALPARLPAKLRHVVQVALRKEPGRRYATADEFARALEAATPGGTRWTSGQRQSRRHSSRNAGRTSTKARR